MGIVRSFPLGKAAGREADHPGPTSAKVKNTWIYASTPPYVIMAYCLVSYAQGQLPLPYLLVLFSSTCSPESDNCRSSHKYFTYMYCILYGVHLTVTHVHKYCSQFYRRSYKHVQYTHLISPRQFFLTPNITYEFMDLRTQCFASCLEQLCQNLISTWQFISFQISVANFNLRWTRFRY
jgi:hypothetical protein